MSTDKFEWTDDLVKEFVAHRWNGIAVADLGRYIDNHIRAFKQEQLNKEWWFVRIKTPTPEEPIGYFGLYEGSEEYRSKEGAYAWFNDRESAIKLANELKKQPVFTTADGKEIFHADPYWYVGHDFSTQPHYANSGGVYGDEFKPRMFSTEAAADEYILMNKPMLSLNELLDVWETGAALPEHKKIYKNSPLFNNFIRLARFKLNMKT